MPKTKAKTKEPKAARALPLRFAVSFLEENRKLFTSREKAEDFLSEILLSERKDHIREVCLTDLLADSLASFQPKQAQTQQPAVQPLPQPMPQAQKQYSKPKPQAQHPAIQQQPASQGGLPACADAALWTQAGEYLETFHFDERYMGTAVPQTKTSKANGSTYTVYELLPGRNICVFDSAKGKKIRVKATETDLIEAYQRNRALVKEAEGQK